MSGQALALSVVIPVYNEELRLPRTLRAVRKYIDCEFPGECEVVIVDDGSSDATVAICAHLQKEWQELHVVQQYPNRGKGAAVRAGIEQASGRYILTMDADQSVPISHEHRLREVIMCGADIAIGSRALSASQNVRTAPRRFLGAGFATLVKILFWLPVRDTQCGFKMYSGGAAKRVWPLVKESRYLADIEMLVRAKQLELRIAEVPISYRDMSGSKLCVWRDSLSMFFSLWALRKRCDRKQLCRDSRHLFDTQFQR